jgi:acetyltransferase-like isoleucine patch superfamily enzyme
MRKLIARFISILKKEKFELDEKIPLTYLFFFFLKRIVSLIYGYCIFRRPRRAFVHISSKIKCKNKIRYGNNLTIGENCYIDALSENGFICGDNVSIGKYTTIECTGSLRYIGKGLKVGNNAGLGTHGFYGCAGGIEIGDDTIFGNFVSLHSENHNFEDADKPVRLQGVNRRGIVIGKNCWIGSKATILDGAVVEDGCIIAAGSVLIAGRYGKNSIYGGVPAKFIRSRI